MNTPDFSLRSSHFHRSSSRPMKPGTMRVSGGTALFLSFLVLSSPAFAQVRLTPSTLSFGDQGVNQSSVAMSATLKNPQAAPLTISSIAISGGTAPADFVAGGNCPLNPSTLSPGEHCNITVTFTPSALGMRTATLTVTDDAGTSPLTVPLSGMGVAPVGLSLSTLSLSAKAVENPGATPPVALIDQKNLAHGRPLNPGGNAGLPVVSPVGTVPSPISVPMPGTGTLPVTVSPASLTFASGAVGTTSGAQMVTLTNRQNTSLTVSAAVATGDFAVASNTCGSSVAPGGSCTVGVTFRPMVMGRRTGTLTLPYSAAGSPSVIALSGGGSADGLISLTVTPANPSIAAGQTQQFIATGLFSDGITQNLTASVTWSSSNPSVATINAAGLATTLTAGSTTITAAYGTSNSSSPATGVKPSAPIVVSLPISISNSSITGSTTLTVTAPVLVSMAVTPANPSVAAGSTQQFTATGTYSNGSTQNLTSTATWTSSAPGVATINTAGLASALVPGQTTIAAGSGAINGSTTLTVTAGFVLTGTLNTARALHTATLLNNGMVLIAGGGTLNDQPLNSAELYNPAAGTFTPTASLNTARYNHTATLLNNGLVLIAGGLISTSPYVTASAELYNPATGTFSPAASLNTARRSHTATLLNNGLVLIAGGYDSSGYATSSAELYNPATGTFSPTARLNTARYNHTATLLNNGLVLIAGGLDINTNLLASAELYNPATGTFTPITSGLKTPRELHTATLLNNGLVLIAGGYNDGGTVGSAELYNPATGTFTYTTNPSTGIQSALNTPRYNHTATLLNNGMVLLAGGYYIFNGFLASAELYDPVAQTFTLTGSLNIGRDLHSATLLNNGMVMMAGGLGLVSSTAYGCLSSAELYEPATLTPPNLLSISIAPASPTISLGTALRFTATGTFSGGDTEQLAEVTWSSSDPGVINVSDDVSDAGSAWAAAAGSATISACAGVMCGSTTATVGPVGPNSITGSASFSSTSVLNVGRAYHTATLLPNGLVLIAGGQDDNSGDATNTAELFDPTAGTFTPTGSLTTARYLHTATLLNNGMVLIAGGYGGNNDTYLPNAELYNPANGTFTPTGSLNDARLLHTATFLQDGQVLIVGGQGNSGFLKSAELYNPATGAFTYTAGGYDDYYEYYGGLNTARYLHTATLLPNGMVLIAGGNYDGGSLNSAELYNPASQLFTYTASNMNYLRQEHTATLLDNGLVLLAGGYGCTGADCTPSVLGSAELYNPATQSFSNTPGGLNYARELHTATLLTNGRVLIAGGDAGSAADVVNYVAGSELYDPASQSFSPSGSLSTPREWDTATLLTNGTVLFTGGIYDSNGDVTTSAELYAPATLTPPNLLSISLAPANPTIALGTAQRFIATGTFSGGNTEQLAEATWTSSDPGVISVSDDASDAGSAWAAAAGSATISACAGVVCGMATAKVGPAGPNSLTGTASFAQVANTLFDYRSGQTATLLPSGQVLLAGGDEDYYGYSAEVYDPAAGTFTPTGFLNYARYVATATLLNNGQVLIVGGYCDCHAEYAGTAELYNPATGVFTPSGILNVPRAQHTATLLPNGQVLIAGGYVSGSPGVTGTAELYDPVSGTFTLTGSMKTPRVLHTATLLPNGQVLMAGGDSEDAADSTELYNPATGAFTFAAKLLTPRWNHTATLLNNGRVLIAGGHTYSEYSASGVTATAELYDPAFSPENGETTYTLGSLNNARELHTATLLNNGLVLIAGGDQANMDGNQAIPSAELYNPDTQTFSNTGSLTTPREWDTATLLNNGSVLFAGGANDYGLDTIYDTAELYSPATLTPSGLVSISLAPADPTIPLGTATRFTATGTFSGGSSQQLAEVTWSSSNPGVISLGDDSSNAGAAWAATTGSATITACAGEVCGSTTATVGPAGPNSLTGSGSFGAAGNMLNQRQYHTATLLPNGQVLMAGGADADFDCLPYAELYDPTTGAFTATGQLQTGRYAHTATLLANGLVLITGGIAAEGTTKSAELYNPANGTFTPTGNMKYARVGHTATLLADGQVLIAGGYLDDGSAELYNPTTGTFTLTGSLQVARENHTATLLNDGTVLIVGGFDGEEALNSAEVYNPAAGTFTELGQTLQLGRFLHTATLLNNGQVLLAGGELSATPYETATAELYNPLTQAFTYTAGSLDAPRFYHTATLLNNGLVLLAGGCAEEEGTYNCENRPLYTADLYDPASGTFALTSYLNVPRAFHTATLLNNGQVLLAGGAYDAADDVTTSTELYNPVTLTPQNLVAISLAPAHPTIPLGSAQRFAATGTFSGGDTEQLAEVTWSSSNPEVVGISNDSSNPGAALAAAPGSVTVCACAGAVCGSTTVTVGPPAPVSIVVTPASETVPAGTPVQFLATGTYSDGTTQDLTSSATWTSSAPGVATINTGGLASGLSGGSTTITAASGTISGSTTLTVVVAAGFVSTGSLKTSRVLHTATMLNSASLFGGEVLVAGGYGSSGYLASAELYSPLAGTFTTLTNTLNTARDAHTATLLNNGMVLIVGGRGASGYLPSAELYDRPTATFTPTTGSLNMAREYHTATMLNNGMVLIVGGYNSTGPVASAELYDPTTQTFTLTATTLNTARYWHTATLLPSGQVLIAGGYGSSGALASAELFDPNSQTFTATDSLNDERYYHTATLLSNGQVLMAGGYGSSGPVASAELYNSAAGNFTTTGSLNTARYWHAAALLTNGQVLVAGGIRPGGYLANAEVYDSVAQTFSNTGSLNIAVGAATATLLEGEQVLIAGGLGSGGYFASAELYEPATLTPPELVSITITPTSSTLSPHTTQQFIATGTFSDSSTEQLAAVTWSSSDTTLAVISNDMTNPGVGLALAAGTVTITAAAGGVSGTATLTLRPAGFVNTTDLSTGVQSTLHTPRYWHTATLLNSGMVLVAGGCADYIQFYLCESPQSSAELYDPATGTFTAVGGLNASRSNHTATLLNNGMVLIVGGVGAAVPPAQYGPALASAELYNPATGTFTPTGNLNTARSWHTATLLNNGMVLIAGGLSRSGPVLSSAELYNPATGTFSYTTGGPTLGLNTARVADTATLLNDGEVLIAGGCSVFSNNGCSSLATAELYDPATGTFAYTTGGPTSGLNTARYYHTATLLNNGMVLMAGGLNSSVLPTNTAELYNPATGTFAYTTGGPTSGLNTPRYAHTATLLNNGTVLVAAGCSFAANNSPLSVECNSVVGSAEVYDPNSGLFTTNSSLNLNAARYFDTATLLNNGMVLVVGGIDVNSNPLASAELY